MDGNQLFWATGINNAGLQTDAQSAISIFQNLSTRINGYLDTITQKYQKLHETANVKFTNPVDPSMIASIKTQIGELGKVIDQEINKLGRFASTYDQSMSRISKSASKLQVGAGSPLAPMVAGIQRDVAKTNDQLSFLERRSKYAFGSIIAYGAVSVFKNLGRDIIEVKTQFEFLQTAINSFAGSAEKGAKIMQELVSFAIKSPLQINDITEAAKQLMAFGIEADNVVGQIKMLSDVSAGAGKPIKDIAYIYGKSLTEGKVYTRTLMQFGNLGIPIYKALADVMDTTPSKIKKMTQLGAIGFDDVKRAIESLTAAGGQYYNFSGKMMSTTAGQLSNLKDKWIKAMKELGEQNDGIINAGVSGISGLISNWKELGETIAVVAAAVGSYQVAKMMVGLGINMTATTANLAEVASLETLVSAEAKATISKRALVVGSVEYSAAIRAEVALLLKKVTATEVAANADMLAATVAMDSAIEQSVAAQANLASKRALIAAGAGEVTAAELVAAKNAVETTQIAANTAARELKIASSKLGIAISEKEAVATGISTATTAGQTAGTDLLAAAKIRLTAITATLNRTIVANPYAAAFVAVATLVTIMWALHDSTTETEKAQKKWGESMAKVTGYIERQTKGFNDALDKLKNPVTSDIEKQKTFAWMQKTFPYILKGMSEQNVIESNAVDLQKKHNDYLSGKGVIMVRNEKIAADAALAEQKRKLNQISPTITSRAGGLEQDVVNPAYTAANSKLKVLQLTADNATKSYNDLNDAQYKVMHPDIVVESKNKKYWDDRVTDAKDALSQINDVEREILDKAYKGKKLGSVKGVDADTLKIYNDNRAKLVEAEKRALIFNDKQESRNAATATKQKISANDRYAAIVRDSVKLSDVSTKAEITLADATLAAQDEGYAKQKALQGIKYKEQQLAVKKQGEAMLKLQNDITTNDFLAKNPKGVPPKDATKLNTANQGIYNNLMGAADIENTAATAKLLHDKLVEYGDYAAERLDIEKKFNADIKALQSERTTKNAPEIDAAVIQAQTDKAKALMAQSFKKLKESPEFAMAFEDLGNVSTATLEKLMGELDKYKQTAAGAMKLSDFKEYSKVIENLTDEFIKRNPFKALKESAEDLKVAQRNLDASKFNLSTVQSGGKINNKGQLIPNGSTEKALSLADAFGQVEMAENGVWLANNKAQKSITKINDSFGELSKNLSSVGSAMGGTAGVIISSIGDIGTFVTTSITAWKAASIGAATAIQVVEKASVILAVIAGVIQVATTIVNLFTEASKKRKEEAEAERQAILDVRQAYLEAYATITNKKFDNVFGEDVWGKALAQAGLMKAATKTWKDAYIIIAENWYGSDPAWAKAMGSDFLRILYNKNTSYINKSIDDFDLLAAKAALAGNDLDEIAKKSLQALVDAYESYQAYLDNIDSYLTSVFGDIGSSMMDSFTSNYDDLTSWADDVTGYISDSFGNMVKDIIYSMYFAKDLADAQAAIKSALTDTDTNDAAQIQLLIIELNKKLMADGTAAAAAYATMLDSWIKAGGQDFAASATNNNSTASAIKSMDQPTADILTAQFSAIRINVAAILAKMPDGTNINMINLNVKDILLSLQTQANSLQMVFSDISKIQVNTARLEAVEGYLYKMVTNGVKML